MTRKRIRWARRTGVLPLACLLGLGGTFSRPEAQGGPSACLLVTSAEMASLLGGKVVATQPSDVEYTQGQSNDHDGVLHLCGYQMDTRSVTLAYSTQPVTAAGKQQAEARSAASIERLRQQGWKTESRQLAGVKCWTAVAPKELVTPRATSTTCEGGKGNYFVSVVVTSDNPRDLVPMESVQRVSETAAARLP